MKKVLITGSNGLLGQKLVNLFSAMDHYNVIAVSLGDNRNSTAKNFKYYSADITDKKTIDTILTCESPNVIINTAALTNVDQCETDKVLCDKINIEAVRMLVQYCEEKGAYLVHISTDFIFDGKAGPYREEDVPNPVNYYGLSKLKSEQIILASGIDYAILRTILVYGIVDNMSRSNIVLFVKQALEQKKEITIVDDQFRMPTLVDDLALACFQAVERKAHGIFNISSNELLSIYEMAVEIARVFKLDTAYIKRIKTSQLNQPARRPERTGFYLDRAHEALGFPFASFGERLQVFKNQLITPGN